jgi:plasmid stability protein
MGRTQANIRLDDDLIAQLKKRAHQQNISMTAVTNQILRSGLEASESNSIASITLLVKLDKLLTTIGSIDRKIRISKEQKNEHNPN